METAIIAIIGMHRSGTSLVSSWLQQCGLDIGRKLVPPNIGNINGHFEDLDFLSFHEGLLLKNSLNYLNASADKIEIDDLDIHLARELISFKSKNNVKIGWKDPRTCLFLNNLWLKTTQDIKFLFIYRPFGQIINSLYSRHIKMLNQKNRYQLINNLTIQRIRNFIYIKKNKKKILEDYCNMYLNYMNEVLKFYNENSTDNNFIAADIRTLIDDSRKLLNTIENNWSISLKRIDLKSMFKQNQFTTEDIELGIVDRALLEKCESIDKKLIAIIQN